MTVILYSLTYFSNFDIVSFCGKKKSWMKVYFRVIIKSYLIRFGFFMVTVIESDNVIIQCDHLNFLAKFLF